MDEFTEKKLTEESLLNIFKRLKESDVISIDAGTLEDDDLSEEIIMKMLETPVPFDINDDGELIVVIDGDEHILDPKRDSVKDIKDQKSNSVLFSYY